MNVHEKAVCIPGPRADMLGIVSVPDPAAERQHTAVVVVVGGAQYRVGSHRQFVQIARHLAGAGYPVLRFDFPGMGDSPGEPISFEDTSTHIAAAINAIHDHCSDVSQVVLCGLCDGASASLLYTQRTNDQRVAGLALLNPWVRSEASLARAQVKHYYLWRLAEPAFWRKLFGGQVGWRAVRDLGNSLQTMRTKNIGPSSFQDDMAQGWQAFKGPILLLLSERDLVAKEFVEHTMSDARWNGLLERPAVSKSTIDRADHTCSSATASRQTESFVLQWLKGIR
ncbi:hydrolase 1, exosortase A system-associated [Hydrogenophaga sp.]|uniref:hydrolase 1, exosortase A system-associated n=1 Tax=Hydrogenophaga sp. TaxID=1904254 RepID=UPI0025BA0B2C|nr:hydrolase 1, exosortase A system-associated [Hydrogenophaga sp.]MBT9465200.1 hydrolase 1, exosortase A system-associated [Hydrogenophaga sp.]